MSRKKIFGIVVLIFSLILIFTSLQTFSLWNSPAFLAGIVAFALGVYLIFKK